MTLHLLLFAAVALGQPKTFWEHCADGAQLAAASDYDAAIAAYTRAILMADDEQPYALAFAYQGRGAARLENNEVQQAIADFSEAIRLQPDDAGSYMFRSEAYRQIGDTVSADADAATFYELSDLPYVPFMAAFHVASDVGRPDIFVAAWLILTVLLAFAGRRQRVDGGGSRLRLWTVAAALAALSVTPAVGFAAWKWFYAPPAPSTIVVLVAVGVAAFQCWAACAFSVRIRGTKESLALVDDAALLARVADIASRMGIATPRVRLVRTMGGPLQTMAWAAGPVAPFVLVTDGVLHRLSPEERDSIVAHEMAHLANGSLWAYLAVTPVCGLAAMIVSAFYPTLFSVLFGIAVWVGLRRMVSRWFEYDCDVRAARALGFGETISALAKVHAILPLRGKGLRSILLYATATHPSRELRLANLYRAAPHRESIAFDFSPRRYWGQRAAGALAVAAWLAALAASLWLKADDDESILAVLPLWSVIVLPYAFFFAAIKPQFRGGSYRGAATMSRWGWLTTVVATAAIAVTYLALQEDLYVLGGFAYLVFFLLLLLGGVHGTIGSSGRKKLLAQFTAAFQAHDFHRVLALAAQHPKQVARDCEFRYMTAVARGVIGDRSAAIAELDQIARDHPKFTLVGPTLVEFLIGDGQFERALDVARHFAQKLKKHAAAHVQIARACRRLGRGDEAQRAVERALQIDPESGSAHAAAAGIALDWGDLARAKDLVRVALDLAPGDAYPLVVAAEIAAADPDADQAKEAISAALRAIEANPFIVGLGFEQAALRAHLARFEPLVEVELVSEESHDGTPA